VRQRTGATRLGDDRLGALPADAGDLVEAVDRRQHRGAVAQPGGRAGGAVCVDALGGGDRGDQLLDPGGQLADLAGQGVDLVQQHPGQLGVMIIEPAGQRLGQAIAFGFHPAAGQPGQQLRVPLAGDQCLQHVPDGLAADLAGHGRDLNQRVFQQFFQPGVVPGALAGQVGAQPGIVPQLADLGRGDERGPQHAPLGELGQPHRIQLVRFGPARGLLDIPGPDQLHRQPGRLQQVEPDAPVIRRGFQSHLLDPLGHQVISKLQDRPGGCVHGPHPGAALARPRRVRHPGAHHPRRLGHIDRGDPLQDLLVLGVLDLLRFHHRDHLLTPPQHTGEGMPAGPRSGTES
jgi:hypothetical protein